MYARVLNDQVDSVGPLPKAWRFADGRSTGNFDLLDEATHLAEGWFPLVDEVPEFDPETEQLGGELLTVGVDQVVRTWEVVALPEPPPPPGPTLAEEFAAYRLHVAGQLADRDEFSDYLSDWLLEIDVRTS